MPKVSYCGFNMRRLILPSHGASWRPTTCTFRIWVQFRPYFGLQSFSASAPLVANAFVKRSNLGIRKFKDFYIAITFASFQQLSDKFSIPKVDYFRFFAHNAFPMFPRAPDVQWCWDSSIKVAQLLITFGSGYDSCVTVLFSGFSYSCLYVYIFYFMLCTLLEKPNKQSLKKRRRHRGLLSRALLIIPGSQE